MAAGGRGGGGGGAQGGNNRGIESFPSVSDRDTTYVYGIYYNQVHRVFR